MRKFNIRSAACAVLAVSLTMGALPLSAAEASTKASYKGEKMCIAVLDNGFVTDHECFTLTDDTPKLTKEASDALIAKTSVGNNEGIPESLYVSEKIPFAYDYGDGDADVYNEKTVYHGTAMISIAAGNPVGTKTENPAAIGIAPEAQILAMKVYSDKTGLVSETALTRAIEDAVILGADVILLTAWEICGIENEQTGKLLREAIEKAAAAGVPTICPVGNVFEYGKESFFELEYDSDPLPTSSVDAGTVAWPATIPSVISVASAVDNLKTGYTFELETDTVPYSDSNYLYPETAGGKLFSSFFEWKELEYAVIDGIGTPEQFAAAGDISGKLAVVERGELSFTEKTVNAAAAGAIGVIVIDNQPHEQVTLDTKTNLSEAALPLILVPMKYKNAFILQDNKTITFEKDKTYTVTTSKSPTISPFSAAGTTPELSLKPDVTAVGSDVKCAHADGGYATINSTTAAASKVAGTYVLIKEKLASYGAFSDAAQLADEATGRLLNSASLITQSSGDTPTSPRRQGAGVVSLDAALSADVILHSGGKYKIELGELSSRFISFKVTAENLSNTEKECSLDAIVGSDGYRTYNVTDFDDNPRKLPLSERLGIEDDSSLSFITNFREFTDTKVRIGDGYCQLNRAGEDYEPLTFTLAPGESLTFTVSVLLGASEYETYKRVFENGFFVEGYLSLTTDNVAASIPFAGFMGDFSKAPALDAQLYDGIAPLFEGVYLYRDYNGEDDPEILGKVYTEGSDVTYRRDSLFFSPAARNDGSPVMLNLGLLRTVTDVTLKLSDQNGNIIKSTDYGTLPRTYLSSTTGMLESPRLPIWNGRAADNFGYIYPDGKYTVELTYRKPSSDTKESLCYDLYLDTTVPIITETSFTISEYKCLLDVTAADNFGLSEVRVFDSNFDDAKITEDGLYDTSLLIGEYIYAEATDYAGNSTVVRLTNPVYVSGDN